MTNDYTTTISTLHQRKKEKENQIEIEIYLILHPSYNFHQNKKHVESLMAFKGQNIYKLIYHITFSQMGIKKSLICFALVLGMAVICSAANADRWKQRTIYQVLTDRFARDDGSKSPCSNLGQYCGGGYVGLTKNLDYIQGMGFDAIWISPIVDNYPGNYHGYAGRNIYQLNKNFGTEKQFVDFITECHKRDIFVMVDVVANHMGNLDEDFSKNVPFNSSSDFHDFCVITDTDFATKNQYRIENCRLAKLADLKQENLAVTQKLLDWIKNLVNKYKIDGIRVDTVPEVPKWFWSQFQEAAGVYAVGEVFDGDKAYVAGYTGSLNGVLNYPFFFTMRDLFFNKKDMYEIRNFYSDWAKHLDASKLEYLATFGDNHDNARVMSWSGNTDDKKKHLKSLNLFVLTSVGIPIVYYGTEQYFSGGDDPKNRQPLWTSMNTSSDMYKFIATVNKARKEHQIWNHSQVERYADHDFYAFSRGKLLVLLTNQVSGGISKTITYHPFTTGTVICNIFYPTTDCITVQSNGFKVYLLNGESKIYVPK